MHFPGKTRVQHFIYCYLWICKKASQIHILVHPGSFVEGFLSFTFTIPMRSAFLLCALFLNISLATSAQEIFTDTFIRKDGIHIVPSFASWQTGSLFTLKKSKSKTVNSQPVLSIEAAERIRFYADKYGDQKTEPFRFFRVLDDLAAHDSITFFERINDLPPSFKSFFQGLYQVEYNEFNTAMSLFDALLNSGDSLLQKEVPFWRNVTQKLLHEQQQHNNILSAYTLFEQQSAVDSTKLFNVLEHVNLPQYIMHRYINLYNYYFRKKQYETAISTYDSILRYTTQSKMKASLAKNRDAVLEMLEGKGKFIAAMNNGLYHYEIDYLYDHLETWIRDTLSDKAFAALAGFKLHQRSTTKTDSIFTRRLNDTADHEQLNKFETLSLIRTPLDKGGRRFIMVKLGFSREDTYKSYVAFLSKFKNKPVQQSVLYGAMPEGDEYMLTQYFIAALYHKDDPIIKYELSLYALQDAEGNLYAVDTLF